MNKIKHNTNVYDEAMATADAVAVAKNKTKDEVAHTDTDANGKNNDINNGRRFRRTKIVQINAAAGAAEVEKNMEKCDEEKETQEAQIVVTSVRLCARLRRARNFSCDTKRRRE